MFCPTCCTACAQVLGGAGPAIAAVPLTAIWAGTSVVTLLASIGSGKVGPVGAGQRVGFVIFMSLAGVVSSFSRMGLAVMTAIPPERSGYLSDRGALTRAVQRPTNAFEAFSRANEEIVAGVLAALYGIILDPTRVGQQAIPRLLVSCLLIAVGVCLHAIRFFHMHCERGRYVALAWQLTVSVSSCSCACMCLICLVMHEGSLIGL